MRTELEKEKRQIIIYRERVREWMKLYSKRGGWWRDEWMVTCALPRALDAGALRRDRREGLLLPLLSYLFFIYLYMLSFLLYRGLSYGLSLLNDRGHMELPTYNTDKKERKKDTETRDKAATRSLHMSMELCYFFFLSLSFIFRCCHTLSSLCFILRQSNGT